MLYHLFTYLDRVYDLPGAGLFQYISFRAGSALIVSLFISLIFGKRIINYLQKKQVGEIIRNLGLEGQMQKQGTPTMGGTIIIASIVIPGLLFSDLTNIYVLLLLFSTLWLGAIGFVDDYIKVFLKNKKGLHGKFKVMGQIGLGLIVGSVLYFNDNVVIREKVVPDFQFITSDELLEIDGMMRSPDEAVTETLKSTKTTIPFFKNNEFDYSVLLRWMGDGYERWTFLLFIPIVILIITAVSNGANMTDGLDGLATGTSAIIVVA
ncbi:MAG: phospho-N-acetylmuramoyl-pentapeptide-transferase, partial [Bacteroidota bacterium]